MRRNLSVFIDLLRVLAAFAVLLSHAPTFVMPKGLPALLTSYGSEAVAVFFVLSGFVIRFASTGKGETDWRAYASARISRLYPVVMLALVTTLLIDTVGRWWSLAIYAQLPGYTAEAGPLALLRALTFTNETWFSHSVVGSDEPLWSLGFEVPYYLLFGIVSFAPTRWRLAGSIAWAMVFGPKILLYLPLWLLGAAAYDFHRRLDAPRSLGILGCAVALVALPFAKAMILAGRSFAAFRSYDAGYMIDGATYYLAIAAATALCLCAFDVAVRDRPIWPAWFVRAISWLAGGSFTLYLVHLPVLIAARAIFPGVRQQPWGGLAAIVVACVVAYGLAEVAERRKRTFRGATDALFRVGQFRPTPAAAAAY